MAKYSDDEIRLTDDPFDDDPSSSGKPSGAGKPKKLLGITDLQKAALKATGRESTGFRDNKQLDLFKEAEKFVNATDYGRVWAAWIAYRIQQTADINTKAHMITVTMDELIRRLGCYDRKMAIKRQEWFTDNEANVLRKKDASEIAGDMDIEMLQRSNGKQHPE